MSGIKVAVIGAGASGSMAAVACAEKGASVTVFEGNEKLGKKIYITGKGRCNVTNATPMPEFMNGISRNPKFLFSAFASFSNADTMRFFEDRGLRLKTERGSRVFPVSDHASDVNKALERALREAGAELRLREKVEDVRHDADHFILRLADGTEEIFDRVILATGGLSYPTTGSTGDGYRFAEKLGHKVLACFPSLVAMRLSDDVSGLEGLSLKNILLTAQVGKKRYEEFGEMLFTKHGISGPVVLSLSSRIAGTAADRVLLSLDWKPALSEEDLRKRIHREREEGPNRYILRLLESLLPGKAVGRFESALGFDVRRPMNQMTKGDQAKLISMLKHDALSFEGLGEFREAVITRGGVSTKEIDPKTMESKLVPGLYFAGEVIDVDAFTGGYNLQIAFSTGHLAGISAAAERNQS